MSIVDKNIEAIKDLCLKYNVMNLCVFGSVLTDKFKKSSDVDFIVNFSDVSLYNYADNYFDFKKSLENVLKRNVDLLEDKAISNPYLRLSIDSSKRIIYG
jgi:predicted nucleotidyltransferase